MTQTMLHFPTLREENPGKSPEQLFDLACETLGMKERWATTKWPVLSNWMDMFANAPTSVVVH